MKAAYSDLVWRNRHEAESAVTISSAQDAGIGQGSGVQ
jgi:hypothetical protein